MPKSDSGSRPGRSHSRSRTLKRELQVREFEEDDLKFFYAAHVMQGGERMDREAFAEYFVDKTMRVDMMYVVTEPYKDTERPLGLVAMTGARSTFEVHTHWMPWASSRDRITAALTFIMRMRQKYTMLFFAPGDTALLMQHLGRYGVARRIGFIHKYLDGETAQLWQAK